MSLAIDPKAAVSVVRPDGGVVAVFADSDLDAALAASFAEGASCVAIGPGRYVLDAQVDIPDGVTLSGAVSATGAPATVVDVTARIGEVLLVRGRSSVIIENLELRAGERAAYVVAIEESHEVTVRNVRVLEPRGAGFATAGCTGCLFEDCEAVGTGLPDGYGFTIGVSATLAADVGTTVQRCRAHGFRHPTGGQGLEVRALVLTGGGPLIRGLHVVGGDYSDNTYGLLLDDVLDPVVEDVRAYHNAKYGLFVRERMAWQDATVTVSRGDFSENGGGGGSYRDDGPPFDPEEGGIRISAGVSRLTGVRLADNRFTNLALDDGAVEVTDATFGACGTAWGGEQPQRLCASPPCLERHIDLGVLVAAPVNLAESRRCVLVTPTLTAPQRGSEACVRTGETCRSRRPPGGCGRPATRRRERWRCGARA